MYWIFNAAVQTAELSLKIDKEELDEAECLKFLDL